MAINLITRHKKVVCKDGFTMSVQANEAAYCEPRNNQGPWTSVEVGFPSEREELLLEYAEDSGDPTNTVYGWVPSKTVYLVITKHGGIISGTVPEGVFYYDKVKS